MSKDTYKMLEMRMNGATLQEIAELTTDSYNVFLFFSEIFLESSKPSIAQSIGKITAAAQTGPANGPLPASSTPQIQL